jgi:hypothetical protein
LLNCCMVETSWLAYHKFLPWGGFAQVADRPDHLSKLEDILSPWSRRHAT